MAERSNRVGWRENADAGPAAGGSRGMRRAVALCGLLAAAGGVFALWFWIEVPSAVRFITLPVAEYSDPNWPTNPWAENDGQTVLACFPEGERAYNFQEHDRFIGLLKSLETEQRRPVVLHVTALAATHDGIVYLLLGDEKRSEPKSWLPMAELIKLFGNCPSKQKLLILDVARSVADPIRGPLNDDVADRLHELLTHTDLNYPVLTSCSPGESALPLEAEQCSVFGYYLAQGLGGAADIYNANGERNEQVSVQELAAFVTARVSRWAEHCAGRHQTPELFGKAADFSLTTKPVERESPPPRTYSAKLVESWKGRDSLRQAVGFRMAPRTANALDASLVRAERAWDGGSEKASFQRLLSESDELQSALKAEPPARMIPSRSMIPPPGEKPVSDELVKALENILAVKASPQSKPEQVQAAVDAFALKAKSSRKEATIAIWNVLVQDPEPTQDRIQTLAELLEKTQAAPSIESLLVQRIAKWRSTSIVWPATAIHALLLSEDAIGQAIALAPAGFPWVSQILTQAAAEHREGERMLFGAKAQAEARAAESRLLEAERDSRSARQQWQAVQSVRRAAEDSPQVLFGTAACVVDGNPIGETEWRAAVDSALGLAELTARQPEATGISLTQWESHLDAWRRVDVPIRVLFGDAAIKKTIAAGEPAALRALLASTLISAGNRQVIWNALAQRVQRLHNEVLELDQADDQAKRRTSGPRTGSGNSAEGDRAACRGRISAELWRLTGLAGEVTPEAWAVRLPKARLDRMAKQDWLGAIRLDRVAVFGDDRGARTPATQQLRMEEQQCRQWLANWYAELGRLRADVPGASAICEAVAADLRQ